jgi:hypothetical protein
VNTEKIAVQSRPQFRVLNPGTQVTDPVPDKTCMMQLGCGGRCACIVIPISM